MTREFTDSREAFTAADEAEYNEYFDGTEVAVCDEDEAPADGGYEEDESDYEDDGQPSEYDEWQDYMGGDDWDHGQCDEY